MTHTGMTLNPRNNFIVAVTTRNPVQICVNLARALFRVAFAFTQAGALQGSSMSGGPVGGPCPGTSLMTLPFRLLSTQVAPRRRLISMCPDGIRVVRDVIAGQERSLLVAF